MFKPLTENLARSRGMASQDSNLALEPEILARSFGAVSPVNEPLPETGSPLVHAEDDFDLPIDARAAKRAAERPPTPSLLSIINARLLSIKPQSARRQKEISQWLGLVLEAIPPLDILFATMEAEHFAAIESRWETIRAAGRELADSLPDLESKVGAAQNFANQSQERKGHRKGDLEQVFEERRRISKWATAAEIKAADERLSRARNAMTAATDKALADQQILAAAESKLANAREGLRLHSLELKRLAAEIRGEPYFDPSTGLSTDPRTFQDPASTKSLSDRLDKHYGIRQ